MKGNPARLIDAMKPNPMPPISPAATASGLNHPNNGKYHEMSKLTKLLLVGSSGRKLWAGIQRVPDFYPIEWPLGALILYLALIAAGIYSGAILSALMSISGNPLLAVGWPLVICAVEFIVLPCVKGFSLVEKQVALMNAFVGEDRFARDSASMKATSWNFKDWTVLLLLILCLVSKAVVLVWFGSYQPQALLVANWSIAVLDFTLHLAGTTTRVPCFIGARLTDRLHLRRRRSRGYAEMGKDGKPMLGAMPFREFSFSTVIPIRCGEVDGHVILHTGSDDQGHHYLLKSPGTLDDSDRAAFLNCQPNHLAQTELARALARVQLELLTAPEMRTFHELESTEPPSFTQPPPLLPSPET